MYSGSVFNDTIMKQRSSLQCQTDTLVESIIQSPALTAIVDAMRFHTDMSL